VISLESVSKRYGSTAIVHDLSFTVAPGEIVGFLGPNGAGKTTTMRMIAGYTAATSGRVMVAGFDMATQNVEAARRIGYLPERPPLYDTLDANKMSNGVHVRLMVTRGIRSTPYQDPRVITTGATVVIVPEYKEPPERLHERGLKLFTVHVRRGDPAVQDPKLNSHSKLNCILACIQAIEAGADEGLMLDPHGFVATCNSTHFFIVRGGEVWTSSGKYCLGGITRGLVLEVCREAGIPAFEKDFSLTDVYGADEAFVTGTFAGVVPVREVDGRKLTDGRGPVVERLQQLYRERVERDVAEQTRP
jgi:branched-chain amino acid aminotransferase